MKVELLASMIGIGFIKTKDTFAFRVKNPLFCQIVNRPAWKEGRIELEQRFWPEGTGVQF